jgi:hypothetical protein
MRICKRSENRRIVQAGFRGSFFESTANPIAPKS